MAKTTKKKPKNLFVRMKCSVCNNANYYLHKSKQVKHLKEKKLALNKFCKSCLKTIEHKESKK